MKPEPASPGSDEHLAPGHVRLRVTVAFDGTNYFGWQWQPADISVQQKVEEALARLFPSKPRVNGCSRTDTGVHAQALVAHFDVPKAEFRMLPRKLILAVNAYLPDDIRIIAAARAKPDFHARFSAASRHYLFRILNRRAPPALEDGRVWHVSPKLDAEAMHVAAQALVGHHDFTTFRAAECQSASPVKTLDRLDVSRRADEIHIEASARSFLHHQIRSFAGTLKLVGEGKWKPRDVAEALAAKDRTRCGPVSPPNGLYLVRVDYPA